MNVFVCDHDVQRYTWRSFQRKNNVTFLWEENSLFTYLLKMKIEGINDILIYYEVVQVQLHW